MYAWCHLVCGLTSHYTGHLRRCRWITLRGYIQCWALVQATNLQYFKQLLFSDIIVQHPSDLVAGSLHVCKIEHPPTPSLINKPPRRCLKVWLCSLPGPLRHRIQHSTAPYLVPHYASIFQRARGFPSGLRQPPVSAGSPAGPLLAIPHVHVFSILAIATTMRGLPICKGAGYTSS